MSLFALEGGFHWIPPKSGIGVNFCVNVLGDISDVKENRGGISWPITKLCGTQHFGRKPTQFIEY